jgi:hypothetical protein
VHGSSRRGRVPKEMVAELDEVFGFLIRFAEASNGEG